MFPAAAHLHHSSARYLTWQYDLKNRRTFLKRCDYPGISINDLIKGGIITVYSRQLTVKDYADNFTASVFGAKAAATVAVINSEAMPEVGKIIDVASAEGFAITELKWVVGSGKPFAAMKLVAEDAITKWNALMGEVGSPAPGTLRAQLGPKSVSGSADANEAANEADMYFASANAPIADAERSSLLLVRPHAVKAGALGQLIDQVLACGFEIKAAQMLQLTRPNAQEFMEVYKGVVPECVDWVDELASGKCVAFQVVSATSPEQSVLALRELCGAHDPEIASHLHPLSLRARFGESKVKNAVHCTDLPEDGPLEVEYFFA